MASRLKQRFKEKRKLQDTSDGAEEEQNNEEKEEEEEEEREEKGNRDEQSEEEDGEGDKEENGNREEEEEEEEEEEDEEEIKKQDNSEEVEEAEDYVGKGATPTKPRVYSLRNRRNITEPSPSPPPPPRNKRGQANNTKARRTAKRTTTASARTQRSSASSSAGGSRNAKNNRNSVSRSNSIVAVVEYNLRKRKAVSYKEDERSADETAATKNYTSYTSKRQKLIDSRRAAAARETQKRKNQLQQQRRRVQDGSSTRVVLSVDDKDDSDEGDEKDGDEENGEEEEGGEGEYEQAEEGGGGPVDPEAEDEAEAEDEDEGGEEEEDMDEDEDEDEEGDEEEDDGEEEEEEDDFAVYDKEADLALARKRSLRSHTRGQLNGTRAQSSGGGRGTTTTNRSRSSSVTRSSRRSGGRRSSSLGNNSDVTNYRRRSRRKRTKTQRFTVTSPTDTTRKSVLSKRQREVLSGMYRPTPNAGSGILSVNYFSDTDDERIGVGGGGGPSSQQHGLDPFEMASLAPINNQDERAEDSQRADIQPIMTMDIDTSVDWDSVGGLDHHIKSLKEMILLPMLYPELFDRWSITPPRGVLFYGPPGTGKTLVARALANTCSRAGNKRVAFFMRKGADCLSKWVGEAERQLRLLFEQARKMQPSIIFFDEVDGLAPVRSSKQDQIHSSIVSTLLALMDGLDNRGQVVVIGATNRIDAIDPALRRPGRFDREFMFTLPSKEARRSIFDIHLRSWKPPVSPKLRNQISDMCVGYCGADLKALCTEAALRAVRRHYPQIYESTDKLLIDVNSIRVTTKDFLAAMKRVTPSAYRSAATHASSLSPIVRPLLTHHLQVLQELATKIMGSFASDYQTGLAKADESDDSIDEEEDREDEDEIDSEEDPTGKEEDDYYSFFHRNEEDNEEEGEEEGSENDCTEGDKGKETVTKTQKQKRRKKRRKNRTKTMRLVDMMQFRPIHRPRVLLHGECEQGQAQVAAALLHCLEQYQVFPLDLASLCADTVAKSLEEACVHTFTEAKRKLPSILFLPHLDSWWDMASSSLRLTLITLLQDTMPDLPLLVLATSDVPMHELPSDLAALFHHTYELFHPTRELRKRFFLSFVEDVARPPPRHRRRRHCHRSLPQLPKAPPPAPRAATAAEKEAQRKSDENTLRKLRMTLRDCILRLLRDRRFQLFGKPVDVEDAPDYYDIIHTPLCLEDILERVDAHYYLTLRSFVEDVSLIVANAEEYNPRHDDPQRIVSKAKQMHDFVLQYAYRLGKHNQRFVAACEEIAQRREPPQPPLLMAERMLNGEWAEQPDMSVRWHSTSNHANASNGGTRHQSTSSTTQRRGEGDERGGNERPRTTNHLHSVVNPREPSGVRHSKRLRGERPPSPVLDLMEVQKTRRLAKRRNNTTRTNTEAQEQDEEEEEAEQREATTSNNDEQTPISPFKGIKVLRLLSSGQNGTEANSDDDGHEAAEEGEEEEEVGTPKSPVLPFTISETPPSTSPPSSPSLIVAQKTQVEGATEKEKEKEKDEYEAMEAEDENVSVTDEIQQNDRNGEEQEEQPSSTILITEEQNGRTEEGEEQPQGEEDEDEVEEIRELVLDKKELLSLAEFLLDHTEGFTVDSLQSLHAKLYQSLYEHRFDWDKTTLLSVLRAIITKHPTHAHSLSHAHSASSSQ